MTKKILLQNERGAGKYALVSDSDFAELSTIRWVLSVGGYADSSSCGTMHRLIMNYPDGMIVDHINGDPLDNRRENLRIVTHHQNAMNSARRSDNKTGYKGVAVLQSGLYRAQVIRLGVVHHLGIWTDAKSAARAYNR